MDDKRRGTVTLIGVNGVTDVSASLGFLIGDFDNRRSVLANDRNAVKSRAGQTANAQNFRFDVNASGVIGAADISSVKARVSAGAVLAP